MGSTRSGGASRAAKFVGALFTGAIAVAAMQSAASAALTVFTDRGAFLAAAGGTPVTETFDTARTFAVGPNLYNGVDYHVYGTTAGGNNIGGGVLNGDLFTSGGVPYGVNYVFPNALKAWGQDFNGAATASGLFFTIDGQTLRLADSLPNPGTGFYGVVSTNPFTHVDISGGASPNEIYSGDNLTYVPAVPEPTTGLALIALAAFPTLSRRRGTR